MRIIGISGVWCNQNPIWNNIVPAFRRRFDPTDFVVEEESWCHPWEVIRLRRFAERIVEKHDDGTDTLIIGHSMGGVVACAAANRFARSRVQGIVTIFSPHRFLSDAFTHAIGAHKGVTVPVVTFSARYDTLVWWGAEHPQSVAHIRLPCDHQDDLVRDSRFSEQIAEASHRHLFPGRLAAAAE
mgnify:CR=1 FL=1